MIGRFLGRLVIAGLAVVTVFLLFDLFTPINAPVGGGGGPLPGTRGLAIWAQEQGAESRDRLWAGVDKLQKKLFVFSPWVSRAEVSLRELHPVDWAALPVIEDCAKLEGSRSDPVPSEAAADPRTAWLASALGSFELRPGYTIGLRRNRLLMHPGGLVLRRSPGVIHCRS
jgi:hypothetical protein